jgi:O-antigen/teichoic acid export membrane protein
VIGRGLLLLGGRIGSAVGTLLLAVASAQVYGPPGRGRTAVAILVGTVASVVAVVGLDAAATFQIASGRAGAAGWLRLALRGVASAGVACGLLLAAVGSFLAPVLKVTTHDILAVAPSVPALMFVTMLLGILLGEQRTPQYALLTATVSIGPAAAFVGLAVGGSSLPTALLGWSCGCVAVAALAYLRFKPTTEGPPPATADSLRYGAKTVLGTIVQFGNYRLDTLLLSAMKGAGIAGVYTVAVNLAEVLGYLASAAESVLFPAFARTAVGRERRLRRALLVVTLVTAAGALVLAIAAGPVVRLIFGAAFLTAVQPLRILLPGMIAIAVAKTISAYLMAVGKPSLTAMVSLLTFAVTILLDLLLIPRHSASGAALASTIAYGVAAAAGWFAYVRVRSRPATVEAAP